MYLHEHKEAEREWKAIASRRLKLLQAIAMGSVVFFWGALFLAVVLGTELTVMQVVFCFVIPFLIYWVAGWFIGRMNGKDIERIKRKYGVD